MKKSDKSYGTENQEQLSGSVIEVIEGLLDIRPEESFDEVAKGLTWPVRVYEYQRMKVELTPSQLAGRVLGDTLESLDEDYGDPEGEPTEPTPAMAATAVCFAETILRDYVPYMCEKTGVVIEVSREQAKAMFTGSPEIAPRPEPADPGEVWVVLRVHPDAPVECQGVFTSRDKAVAACRRRIDCVCPTLLDQPLPQATQPWPGAFYPLRSDL